MGKFTIIKSLAAALLVSMTANMQAQREETAGFKLFMEEFNYPAGRLANVAPGIWKNYSYFLGSTPSADKDSVMVVENNLTYPGFRSATTGACVQLLSKGKDATAVFPALGGTVYTSMLVNVKAAPTAGDFFFSLVDSRNSNTDGFGRIFIKNSDGKLAFGVGRKGTAATATWTSAIYDFNTTYMVVLKYVQVPGNNNDTAELFVNPDITGAEPTGPISGNVGDDPATRIAGMNLYQGQNLGNDLLVDAIRVATSWETLFDRSLVVRVPEIFVSPDLNLGTFAQGGEPKTEKLNIKAKYLEDDITISYLTDGYFTIPSQTIKRSDAVSEKGFDLVITLNPKDDVKKSDFMTFVSGDANAMTSLVWAYKKATPEVKAENIAAANAATEISYYTLTHSVTIAKIDTLRRGYAYTLEDASGTLHTSDNFGILTDIAKVGIRLVNLRLYVDGEAESHTFKPTFSITESPGLFTEKPATGVKLFNENFNYPVGKLADMAPDTWKDYNSFFTSSNKDSVMVVENSLTLEGYQPETTGNSVKLITKGRDATTAFPAMGGTIYTSMLVNVKAAPTDGDYFFSLADTRNSTSEGFGLIHIKNVDGKLAFGVNRRGASNTASWTAANYELGTTYLLVFKYVQVAGNTNDIVALFVNPDVAAAEPADPLTGNTGNDPSTKLANLNLYQGQEKGNDLLVDAIRIATSWEALFDHSGVAIIPEILTSADCNLGNFLEGGAPKTQTLKVKAKNLTEDITINFTSDGYFTVPSNTISKEAAQSPEGFNLIITLNPKDGNKTTDIMTFTSGSASATTGLIWSYSKPRPDINVNDIAEAKAVQVEGNYTIVNAIKVIKVDTLGRGMINYTFEDASGTLVASDMQMILMGKVVIGSSLDSLRLRADSEPESHTFTPIFTVDESPKLVITPPTGIENTRNNAITGYVNGDFIAEGAVSINVYDLNGRQLAQSREGKIGISSLNGSVFIIRYTDEAGISHSVKLIK